MRNGTPWWGGGEYQIGDQPSPHVAGPCLKFLRRETKNGPLADIGVLGGRNLPPLLALGGEVVATDTAEAGAALAKARQRFPKVHFITTLITALPFGDGTLGGALCWRVLHNITNPRELVMAWAELNRVLAPNAPLVIAVRSERHHDDHLARLFVRRLPNGGSGVREDVYFTNGGFRLLAGLTGFTVMDLLPDVEGGENIDGREVTNRYLVAHLLKTAPIRSPHLAVAEKLVVRP